MPTALHQELYLQRVGKETLAARLAVEKLVEDTIEQRKLIKECYVVRRANKKHGHEYFLIQDDLENENFSRSHFKWMWVYCVVLQSFCLHT